MAHYIRITTLMVVSYLLLMMIFGVMHAQSAVAEGKIEHLNIALNEQGGFIVSATVILFNEQGQAISSLTSDDFQVWHNKKLVTATMTEKTGALTTLLLIDRRTSMLNPGEDNRRPTEKAREDAVKFLRNHVKIDDQIALFFFDGQLRDHSMTPLHPLSFVGAETPTTVANMIITGTDYLDRGDAPCLLYHALYQALTSLSTQSTSGQSGPSRGRLPTPDYPPALILTYTGGIIRDRNDDSNCEAVDLIKQTKPARERDIPLFFINYGNKLDDNTLAMAELTAGAVLTNPTSTELEAFYNRIQQQRVTYYQLEYSIDPPGVSQSLVEIQVPGLDAPLKDILEIDPKFIPTPTPLPTPTVETKFDPGLPSTSPSGSKITIVTRKKVAVIGGSILLIVAVVGGILRYRGVGCISFNSLYETTVDLYKTAADLLSRKRSAPSSMSNSLAAELEVRQKPEAIDIEAQILLNRQLTYIGRNQPDGKGTKNHIDLPHPSVSRRHAEIRLFDENDEQWYGVRDISKENELLVAGVICEKYAWSKLRNGDLIEIGEFVLRYKAPPRLMSQSPRSDNEPSLPDYKTQSTEGAIG